MFKTSQAKRKLVFLLYAGLNPNAKISVNQTTKPCRILVYFLGSRYFKTASLLLKFVPDVSYKVLKVCPISLVLSTKAVHFEEKMISISTYSDDVSQITGSLMCKC